MAAARAGVLLRLGDRTVRDQFNANVTGLLVTSSDGVHPNQTGHNLLGACWAKGFYQAILAPPGGHRKPW